MHDLVSMLKHTQLFAGLPEAILESRVIPTGCLQEYQKDQFLIEPQQRVDRIGLVVSGKIQILHLYANGSHSLMGVILPGEFSGADLICTRSHISPYHARAATATQVFWLPAALLNTSDLLDEVSRLSCLEQLLQMISRENMKKEYRLAILSCSGLRDRIMIYLSMQAGRRQTFSFRIPFNREELASFLCVNRSALSHELSKMRQEGLISFRKNEFTLHHANTEHR